MNRAFNTLGDTKDICTWDISIAGAQELNSTVNFTTVDPDVYYFSYENEKTFPVGKQLFFAGTQYRSKIKITCVFHGNSLPG